MRIRLISACGADRDENGVRAATAESGRQCISKFTDSRRLSGQTEFPFLASWISVGTISLLLVLPSHLCDTAGAGRACGECGRPELISFLKPVAVSAAIKPRAATFWANENCPPKMAVTR